MPQKRPQGQKKNTYLEDAFALANAWDSRKRHMPENTEQNAENAHRSQEAQAAREALRQGVPKVETRSETLRANVPEVLPEKERLRSSAPRIAQTKPDGFDSEITAELDVSAVAARLAENKAQKRGQAEPRKRERVNPRKRAAVNGAQERAAVQAGPDAGSAVVASGVAGFGSGEASNPPMDDVKKVGSSVEGSGEEVSSLDEDDGGRVPNSEGDETAGKRKSVDPSMRAAANFKAEQEQPSKEKEKKPKKARSPRFVLKVIGIVVAVVVLLAIGLASYAALNRWVLTDDAADICGTWRMDGATSSIVISDSTIDLAGEATFDYVIDPGAKNIYEKMSNVTGEARYRFSGDRQSIALFDEGAGDWIDTAKRDFDWFVSCLQAKLSGSAEPDLLGGESGVILHRQTTTTVSGVASTGTTSSTSDEVAGSVDSSASAEAAADGDPSEVDSAGE